METDLKIRTKGFAHDCVKIALLFPNDKLGGHIKGQLIRCATSVAANYRSACIAQSKKSLIAKLSIVIEETDESNFWLEFTKDENVIKEDELIVKLINESKELTAIFITSRKTAQENLKNIKQ